MSLSLSLNLTSNASQTCIEGIGIFGTPTATQASEAPAPEICLHAGLCCASSLSLCLGIHRFQSTVSSFSQSPWMDGYSHRRSHRSHGHLITLTLGTRSTDYYVTWYSFGLPNCGWHREVPTAFCRLEMAKEAKKRATHPHTPAAERDAFSVSPGCLFQPYMSGRLSPWLNK